MPRDGRFWRNVAMITVAHVAIAIALVSWSRGARTPDSASVVWMSDTLGTAPPSKASIERTESPSSTAAPRLNSSLREEEEKSSNATPSRSEIQLPVPTASPTPILRTPAPRPEGTPVPKATPRKTATPTPKPTPKKTAKPKPTPAPTPKSPAKASDQPKKTEENEKEKNSAKSNATPSGLGGGKSGVTGAGGGSTSSEFAWYGKMLYDRFYSSWVQPTTSVPAGAKMSALVRIRIEKDGRISKFNIVRPSGNVAVDESVSAVASRVTRVDPLPLGLVGGDYYEVKINFELNPTE
jgi:TonB family protein